MSEGAGNSKAGKSEVKHCGPVPEGDMDRKGATAQMVATCSSSLLKRTFSKRKRVSLDSKDTGP